MMNLKISFFIFVKIISSQIEALRSLKTEHGSKLVNNFRPIQSLNDRDVRRILRKI